MQTKVMNEGAATYVHYRIVTTLHDEGRLSDGAYMEFLQTHTNVVYQPMFDTHGYNGINPYALGFGMMTDIERICTDPTEEIGRAHDRTPVTNAQIVCRLMLEQKT